MPSSGTRRFRNFCFTLNNYTSEDENQVRKLPYRYLVYGYEVGDSGTPHLQGYVELKAATRFGKIHTTIPRAHIESRRGTALQASEYCKKDGKFYEDGKISSPGQRTDILSMYAAVKEGKTDLEIQESHTSQYVKYYRAVDRMRYNLAKADQTFSPVEVIVRWGQAGTGKTRYAYDTYPDLYRIDHTNSQLWFDGYQGQETVLLDDFYGGIKYSYLLQLLDGYKFQLPVKGGFTWKQWRRVIITSNKPPSDWYSHGMTPALQRRLTLVNQVGV